MEDANTPDIQRTNLGSVALALKSLGIDDLLNFDFMDPPPPETLMKALEVLYALAALNDRGELTKIGRKMAEFPLDPKQSKMILYAEKLKCVDEVVTISAMLSVGPTIFYRPREKSMHADNARKNFFKPGGDHLTLLNVYNQWEETQFSLSWCYENFLQYRSLNRVRDIREQLLLLLDRVDIELSSNLNDSESIRKAITAGFFINASRINKNGSYTTLKHAHTVELHPHSSLFGQSPLLVVFTELVMTTKEYMRNAIEIQPNWLVSVAPHYYREFENELAQRLLKNKGRSRE